MYIKKQLLEHQKPNIFISQDQNINNYQQQHNNLYQNKNESFQNNIQYKEQANAFNKNSYLDIRRVNRAKYQFLGVNGKNNGQENQFQRKEAVKMNMFRQSAQQRQRQFHQQNHQYLRMFTVISTSAMNQNKFQILQAREGKQNGANKGQNKTNKASQNFATVHLQLFTEMTSSLIASKFAIKDTYNMVPLKKQSIEFESRSELDPSFQFFVFQGMSQKIRLVRHNLQNVLQQGLSSQFKRTVIRTIGNISFFQFLYLINPSHKQKPLSIEYPKQILQIALQNQLFEINSDEEELFIKTEIQIEEEETDQRMVTCQEFDLEETAPGVYFEIMDDYALYKKYRQVEFKTLKIYDKDISINTDIRNIISSEKIYLIQLVKELDLYIKLSTHNAQLSIMKEIYKQLKRKSEQFLKLLCGYTESKILKQYNIENYPQKIMSFIQKCIKYKKQVFSPSSQLLEEYPILRIWYEIPAIVFGYSRQTLHHKYYDLIQAILRYEQKINDMDLQKQLSIKRPGIQYPE